MATAEDPDHSSSEWSEAHGIEVISMSNDGSAYLSREPRYDGKTDYFFNESGNMNDAHGHVVEGRDSTPERTTYDYVRDVDGTVYVNR